MAEPEDEATILPADYSLLKKIGPTALDKLLSPEAVRKAEKVITAATNDFFNDCLTESAKLQNAIAAIKDQPNAALDKVIDAAFAIKVKAGQCQFDLVAELAKSMHILSEETKPPLSAAFFKVIEWHAQSIAKILELKIGGQGGDVGKAILAEIGKIGGGKKI